MALRLSAKRLSTGKTQLQWSGQLAGRSTPSESHTVLVDSLPEARGSVALGSGFSLPFSQWDNLTVTALASP